MTNQLHKLGAAVVGLTVILALEPSSAPAAPPLENEFRRHAEAAGGTVGVAAIHIESGQRASLRGSQRFTMMSCYKFPIALTLLHRVGRGEAALEKSVAIRPSAMRLGRSPLAAHYPDGGVTRTVGELMEAMIVESDNTASDLVLREAGGAAAVSARLRELGISEIRVDRPEAWLALDHAGLKEVPPEEEWTLAKLQQLFASRPAADLARSARTFVEDRRDTATPDAMADLLALFFRGKALDAGGTKRLFDLMARSVPAPDRLKGKLPPGTPVAHKSGLSMTVEGWTGAINDVGIITLPDGEGHIAIAVFVKGSDREIGKVDAAVAGIARAAYDHWARPAPAR